MKFFLISTRDGTDAVLADTIHVPGDGGGSVEASESGLAQLGGMLARSEGSHVLIVRGSEKELLHRDELRAVRVE